MEIKDTEATIILKELIDSAQKIIDLCKDNTFDRGIKAAERGRIITYKEYLNKLYKKQSILDIKQLIK